ncbi:K1586-like protein [Mya arenaria]|uniref:K1586-like protein n=1 Tax=Mya arenaria TaxID=6604 RepID=A0ABY7EJK9_MYAAR|nr:K1586-like protein [Mya arenaria]
MFLNYLNSLKDENGVEKSVDPGDSDNGSSSIAETTNSQPPTVVEPHTSNISVEDSPPATPTRKTVKTKHRVGFDSKWKDTRPWLYTRSEESDKGQVDVMFCKLCQKHNTKGLNGSAIWNIKGCATLRQDKVADHENSDMHRKAMRIETEVQLDIGTAFRDRLPMGPEEFKAVTCAMKILHFLIKHNVPQTTVFKDFIDFATTELKCPDLKHLKQGKNATYTSTTTTDEFLQAMVEDIEETVKERVLESPGYAVMTDETTDISNKKHLAFCVKYVDQVSGETCVDFIKDVRVFDGKAETIFNETKTVIEDLSVDKFVAFASDGCNTMIGKKTGVSTRLKEMKPEIVTIHCHNHRLALAAKDSFESIKVMRDTDDLLTHSTTIHRKVLDDSGKKKIKQAAHTRWLSHLDAVTSLRDTYQAVNMDLENAIEAGNDKVRLGSGPSANGLVKN